MEKERYTKGLPTVTWENAILGNFQDNEVPDGIFTTTQQNSNIGLPGPPDNETGLLKTLEEKKAGLVRLKDKISTYKSTTPGVTNQDILNFVNTHSSKFSKIVELTLHCGGPVFIFSNWLTYGVEALGVILSQCGYKLFDGTTAAPGVLRFFVWSGESKSSNAELVNKARNMFNSPENKDGQILKVILGTRSVMEGVSFLRVKQVHITDPWWNESRINQIIARASRFCSHKDLDADQQFVDVYRHFSVFSSNKGVDDTVREELESANIQDLSMAYVTIDQKITDKSKSKNNINLSLDRLMKSCSIDVRINSEGNIKRLEEEIYPVEGGNYALLYYDNVEGTLYRRTNGKPRTQDEFLKDLSLPLNVITARSHFITDVETVFLIQVEINDEEGIKDVVEIEDDESNVDDVILPLPSNLIVKENIDPWKSNDVFKDLDVFKGKERLKQYFLELHNKMKLIPEFRKKYFNEKVTPGRIVRGIKTREVISFDRNDKTNELLSCVIKYANDPKTKKGIRDSFFSMFTTALERQKINDMIAEMIGWGVLNYTDMEQALFLALSEKPVFYRFYNQVKADRARQEEERRRARAAIATTDL